MVSWTKQWVLYPPLQTLLDQLVSLIIGDKKATVSPQNLSLRLNASTVGEQMSRSSLLRSRKVIALLFTRSESAWCVPDASPKYMSTEELELWVNNLG